MQTIRRITISSAFKVGAVLCGLLFLIFGFFFFLLPGLFGASLIGAIMGDQGGMGAFGMGAGTSILLYLVGIVVYAVLGGIGFAIEAFFYNIVAGIVGGIEIELS
ncbi:MAG: hypothetical protein GXP38_16510 [Chloroflexi bacterium]|nr:hypothetical protein [Chloroflexota bacterium]